MSLCKVGSLFGRVEMETILSHTLQENSNLYDLVIGASLTEPHTYVKYSELVCIYIYIYIYRTSCRIFLFDATKMAVVGEQCLTRCRNQYRASHLVPHFKLFSICRVTDLPRSPANICHAPGLAQAHPSMLCICLVYCNRMQWDTLTILPYLSEL